MALATPEYLPGPGGYERDPLDEPGVVPGDLWFETAGSDEAHAKVLTWCQDAITSAEAAVATRVQRWRRYNRIFQGFAAPRSEWSPDTHEERPFDIERARRAYAQANERSTTDEA